MNHDRLFEQLRSDEGWRAKPYRDTVGKLTIGYGHNLDAKGISRNVGELLLAEDAAEAIQIVRVYPWFDGLSDLRQEVVTEMAFQLGTDGFAEFRATIAALAAGDHEKAARQMLASKVAREQAQARWQRHAERMRRG